jgi:photosystem II stability/assembly factor-like uncharacterized protein
MKKFVLYWFIFSTYSVNAQWEQCNLAGGSITDIITKDSTIIAGVSESYVYISENYALNWNQAGPGITGNNFIHLTLHGNDIYASGSGRIFKSIDNGQSWDTVFTLFHNIWALQSLDNFIYAASPDNNGYLYSSSDSGITWTLSNQGMTNIPVYSLGTDGTNLFAGTDTGIYKSTNHGSSWYRSSSGLPEGRIMAITTTDLEVFVCVTLWNYEPLAWVYKSIDEGDTWTPVGNIFNEYLYDIIIAGGKLYVSSDNGVFINDGNLWEPLSNGFTNLDVKCLAKYGSDLFAGTNDGIYWLQTGSSTWLKTSNGIFAFNCSTMTNIQNKLFAGMDNVGIFLTSDHGSVWTSKNAGLNSNYIRAMEANNGVIFVGTGVGMYRSETFGDTWEMPITGYPANPQPASLLSHDSIVYMGYWGGLHKSCDNGITWFNTGSNLPNNPDVVSLSINQQNELFAVLYDMGVFMSTNNGTTWNLINHGYSPLQYAREIVSCDTTLLVSLSWNPPIVYSNNLGITWNVGNNGLFGHNISKLKAIGNYVFAGLNDGIFFSKNQGLEWNDITDNLPVAEINSIGRDDSCLYVGVRGHGIWKRPLSDFNIDFSSLNENEIIPNIKIFPNPVSTTLYLNNTEPATVEILNLQGQSLVTQHIKANGSLDVSGLKSGVYLVRVRTTYGVLTSKFVKQ